MGASLGEASVDLSSAGAVLRRLSAVPCAQLEREIRHVVGAAMHCTALDHVAAAEAKPRVLDMLEDSKDAGLTQPQQQVETSYKLKTAT